MTEEAKQKKFFRLDDLSSGDWKPLSLNQLKQLNSIKLTAGNISIDRTLLALLLGERERLLYVAESARWLSEIIEQENLVPKTPRDLEPPDLERCVHLLKEALIEIAEIEKDIPPHAVQTFSPTAL